MKIKYSSDVDVCLIELKSGTPIDSIDLKEGVILHLDKDANPLEIKSLTHRNTFLWTSLVSHCQRSQPSKRSRCRSSRGYGIK